MKGWEVQYMHCVTGDGWFQYLERHGACLDPSGPTIHRGSYPPNVCIYMEDEG